MTDMEERMDDFELMVNWRGGTVQMDVWELFQEHLDDLRVLTEMISLVEGGGEVMDVPPILASVA